MKKLYSEIVTKIAVENNTIFTSFFLCKIDGKNVLPGKHGSRIFSNGAKDKTKLEISKEI